MALPSPTTSDPRAPLPAGPRPDPDWPIQATDQIVKVVDTVRDKTTGPALNVARWLTYGLVLVLLAIPVFLVVLLGVIRGFEGLLLWAGVEDPIWIVYTVLGVLFTLGGLFAWRAGKRPAAPA